MRFGGGLLWAEKGREKVKDSRTELKFLLSCVLLRRAPALGLGVQLGTACHGSWLSRQFPAGTDGESPVSGAGQGGVKTALGLSGRGRFRRGRGRQKPATQSAGSPTRECGLGLAGWAAPGLSTQGLEGFGLGAGSAALLRALAALAFQLTLPPMKTGNSPREREPSGPPRAARGESRFNRETGTTEATETRPREVSFTEPRSWGHF